MLTKSELDKLYNHYNSRKWVHPDPLEFLYNYPDLHEREIVAFIASSLAYGRVVQILKSVSTVLTIMGPSPRTFLNTTSHTSLNETFKDFKHRFTKGEDLVLLLLGIKRVVKNYRSLYQCFLAGYEDSHKNILPALSFLVKELRHYHNGQTNALLPIPENGSACKKLNLFLRWMVREDTVDPGGWKKVNPSKLIIPLDTHMHRFGTTQELTYRKNADMQTALEITQGFRKVAPADPVKYDFALTRLGIRKDPVVLR